MIRQFVTPVYLYYTHNIKKVNSFAVMRPHFFLQETTFIYMLNSMAFVECFKLWLCLQHKVFLCPAFRFTSFFYRHTYWLKIQFSFVLVHSNITPYHCTFRVTIWERNAIWCLVVCICNSSAITTKMSESCLHEWAHPGGYEQNARLWAKIAAYAA